MATDFRASQIQTGKIIATGSLGGKLAIYGIETAGASLNLGTITDTKLLTQLNQKDTFLFVSGAVGSRGTNIKGTTVFGGDVFVSGAFYNSGSTTMYRGVVYNPIIVTASYSINNSEYIVGVSASSAMTLTMPATPAIGQNFIIKDVVGNAPTKNIKINGNGRLIDGKIIYTMTTNYQSINIINFGSFWSII
jgi:hypothetical protein